LKLKSILVISGIAAIILIVAILPKSPTDIAPEMTDRVEIKEETIVELVLDVSESPEFSEEISLEETNVEFYIDENGVKHYVIEVEDSPIIGD